MNRLVQPTSADSPQGRERLEPWLARFGSWLLIAIALFLLLPWTLSFPLLDEDEPINAEKAREMMDAHEWLVPTFNGQPDLEKPPLVSWLMRAGYSVLGANGFAARLPSILATIGLALVVNAIGRRWFSARAGFAAAFGLLTCVQVLIVGHAAVPDMPMVFSVAVAEYACFRLLRHQESRYPWRWFVAMYVGLGYRFHWYAGMGAALVVVAIIPLVLGSAVRQVTPAVQLQELFDQQPPDAEFVAYGHPRFSLLFYSHRRWPFPKEISEL
jgi:4-amino-4-deoxy-L-arabinose transferase-like glycosyltransferase